MVLNIRLACPVEIPDSQNSIELDKRQEKIILTLQNAVFIINGYFRWVRIQGVFLIINKDEERKMGNIIEKCQGCDKIDANDNCRVYANPAVQMRWVDGQSSLGCAFNRKTHVVEKAAQTKQRVGQQKQKKK